MGRLPVAICRTVKCFRLVYYHSDLASRGSRLLPICHKTSGGFRSQHNGNDGSPFIFSHNPAHYSLAEFLVIYLSDKNAWRSFFSQTSRTQNSSARRTQCFYPNRIHIHQSDVHGAVGSCHWIWSSSHHRYNWFTYEYFGFYYPGKPITCSRHFRISFSLYKMDGLLHFGTSAYYS